MELVFLETVEPLMTMEEGTRLESLQDLGPWCKQSLLRNERMEYGRAKDSWGRYGKVPKASSKSWRMMGVVSLRTVIMTRLSLYGGEKKLLQHSVSVQKRTGVVCLRRPFRPACGMRKKL